MKIQKKYQGAIPLNRIANESNESEINTYSTQYLNNKLAPLDEMVVENISNKNVLNKALFVDNRYLWFDVTEHDDNNIKYWRTGVQKIKPNTTYYSNKKMNTIILYDIYRKPLRAISDITEISTNNNEYYIQISFAKSGDAIDGNVILSKKPNDDYVANIDSSNLEHYSTVEQKIGTWIDGKPLYRKIYRLNNLPSTNTDLVDITSLSIQEVTKLYGLISTHNNFTFPMPLSDSDANYSVLFKSGNTIRGRGLIGTGYESYVVTIIIEYTKTTD